jgi:molecular chaperone DnaK (HSP70)
MIKIDKKNNKYDYFFPEEISKFILEKLVKSSRIYLDNKPIKKVVITVPANIIAYNSLTYIYKYNKDLICL